MNSDDDYSHEIVNHSVTFKDSETGVHTNTVEGINSGIKRKLPIRSRVNNGIDGHLNEFIWKKKHEDDNLWDCFVSVRKEMHYDFE